jgi:hypothetical protein
MFPFGFVNKFLSTNNQQSKMPDDNSTYEDDASDAGSGITEGHTGADTPGDSAWDSNILNHGFQNFCLGPSTSRSDMGDYSGQQQQRQQQQHQQLIQQPAGLGDLVTAAAPATAVTAATTAAPAAPATTAATTTTATVAPTFGDFLVITKLESCPEELSIKAALELTVGAISELTTNYRNNAKTKKRLRNKKRVHLLGMLLTIQEIFGWRSCGKSC